jgi:hypothetical protein
MSFHKLLRLIFPLLLIAFSNASRAQQNVGFAVSVFYDDHLWRGLTISTTLPADSNLPASSNAAWHTVAQCANRTLSTRPVLDGFTVRVIPEREEGTGAVTARVILHANHINRIREVAGIGCTGQVVDADAADIDRVFVIGADPTTVVHSGPIRVDVQQTNMVIAP